MKLPRIILADSRFNADEVHGHQSPKRWAAKVEEEICFQAKICQVPF